MDGTNPEKDRRGPPDGPADGPRDGRGSEIDLNLPVVKKVTDIVRGTAERTSQVTTFAGAVLSCEEEVRQTAAEKRNAEDRRKLHRRARGQHGLSKPTVVGLSAGLGVLTAFSYYVAVRAIPEQGALGLVAAFALLELIAILAVGSGVRRIVLAAAVGLGLLVVGAGILRFVTFAATGADRYTGLSSSTWAILLGVFTLILLVAQGYIWWGFDRTAEELRVAERQAVAQHEQATWQFDDNVAGLRQSFTPLQREVVGQAQVCTEGQITEILRAGKTVTPAEAERIGKQFQDYIWKALAIPAWAVNVAMQAAYGNPGAGALPST